MKKASFLVILVIVVLLPSFVLAEPRGDFKTLYLGDSEDIVSQKLNDLADKGEIVLYDDGAITTNLLNHEVEVSLDFFDDKLCTIDLSFPQFDVDHINTDIKAMLENEIKPMVTELYGPPTEEDQYPKTPWIIHGYVYQYCKWKLYEMTIGIGVSQDYIEDQYCAEVRIYNDDLEKEKRKSENTGTLKYKIEINPRKKFIWLKK
jgi:hypothetical protein